MTGASTTADSPYLSRPIAQNTYVFITREQYDRIAAKIDSDPSLVASLNDYKLRWVAMDASDDETIEVGIFERFPYLISIIFDETKNMKAARSLWSSVLLRYLHLR